MQSFTAMSQSLKIKNCITLTLNTQFLEYNFDLIKQCMARIQEVQAKQIQQRYERDSASREVNERLNYIQRDISNHKALISEQEMMIQDCLGEEFRNMIGDLKEKVRVSQDIENLAKQIQALNKFVSREAFVDFTVKNGEEIQKMAKMGDHLGKFVENIEFRNFKNQTHQSLSETNNNIAKVQEQTQGLGTKITDIDQKATKATKDVMENSNMMKEINFTDMQLKLKKIKDQTQSKLSEMSSKLKKKIGTSDLADLEKNLVEKLDGFLLTAEKVKADRDQTKDALSFLEKRINQITQFLSTSSEGEENDALFAAKKWNCASCSKDLGKFEGKLGQYKPWSVFPCRELDPEKSGGYGYLHYVDKLAYKRGLSVDDTGLQRISKTYYEKDKLSRQSSPNKMNTTKATNFMNNYGTSEKNSMSLKEEYFKNNSGEKGSRFFRVKKELRKELINDPEMEKVKEL